MTYTAGSSTITQQGTDADLSGLIGLAGVTVISVGTGSLLRYKYVIAGYKLRITGTQTIQHYEELLFDHNAPNQTLTVAVTGVLNIGTITQVNGLQLFPDWTPLTFTKQATNGASEESNDIQIEGTFRQMGGVINTAGSIVFESASVILLSNGTINGTALNDVNTRIRQKSLNLTILNQIIQGSLRFDFFKPAVSAIKFQPRATNYGGCQVLSSIISGGSDLPFEFEDYAPRGITYAADAFGGAILRFINLDVTGNFLVTHNNRSSSSPYYPITEILKKFQLNVKDTAGNPIQNVRLFIRDYNNGNRPGQNGVWNDGTSTNYAPDRTHNVLSNAMGDFPQVTVLTRTIREGQSYQGSYPNPRAGWTGSAASIVEYRSKYNNHTDIFDIHLWAYGYQYLKLLDITLLGLGVLPLSAIMLPDLSVSEADPAVASAYSAMFTIQHQTNTITVTNTATLDELYDYIKYDKIQEANIETPSISSMPAEADGKILDLTNYNFIVNGIATINPGIKFNAIRTSALATIHGRSNVGIIDVNGPRISIYCNVPYTRLFIAPSTEGANINVSTDINGIYRFSVAANSTLEIMAKANGYIESRQTLDTSVSLEISINLAQDNNISLTTDINAINNNHLSFEYVPNGKSRIQVAINLISQLAKSKRAVDRLFSSAAGIEFLYNYNRDGSLNHILGGRPIKFTAKTFAFNEDKLDFIKNLNFPLAVTSRIGIAAYRKNESSPYEAPYSDTNGRVLFDNLSEIVALTGIEIANAGDLLINNPNFINPLLLQLSQKTVEALKDSELMHSYVPLEFVSSDSFHVTPYEAKKALQRDTEAGFRHDTPDTDYQNIIYKTNQNFEGLHAPTIIMDVLDSVLVDSNAVNGQSVSMEIYIDYDIDDIDDNAAYRDSHVAIHAGNGLARTVSIPLNRKFNRIIIMYRSNQQNDDFKLRLQNFRLSVHGLKQTNYQANENKEYSQQQEQTDTMKLDTIIEKFQRKLPISVLATIGGLDMQQANNLLNSNETATIGATNAAYEGVILQTRKVEAAELTLNVLDSELAAAPHTDETSHLRIFADNDIDAIADPLHYINANNDKLIINQAYHGQQLTADQELTLNLNSKFNRIIIIVTTPHNDRVTQSLSNLYANFNVLPEIDNTTKDGINYTKFWEILTTDINTDGTFGKLLNDNLNAPISAIPHEIETALLNSTDGQDFFARILEVFGQKLAAENLNAAMIASAVWNTLTESYNLNGTFAKMLKDEIPKMAQILEKSELILKHEESDLEITNNEIIKKEAGTQTELKRWNRRTNITYANYSGGRVTNE